MRSLTRPFIVASSAFALVALASFTPARAIACGYNESAECMGPIDPPADDFDPSRDSAALRFDLYRASPTLRGAFATNDAVHGVATSLHARAGRHAALEMGFDLGFGKGPGGLGRYELGFRLPQVLVYLNPASRTQLYAVSGFTMHVVAFGEGDASFELPDTPNAFFYLGGVIGAGVEHHTSKDYAYTLELRGFARARIDGRDTDLAASNAEFHQATRLDTGVILSAGVLAF